MDQISRPMQVALVAVVLFAAAWMTVLRPSAEGDAGGDAGAAAEPAGAPVAAAAAPSAPAAEEGVPHLSGRSDRQRAAPPARGARTTVLLFAGRGADDGVARQVVRSVRREGLRVIVASPAGVARHQRLLGGVEVLSTPTIVVVGPTGTARRIEGLPDAALLEQAIAEAR